jgi:hypothetical protein
MEKRLDDDELDRMLAALPMDIPPLPPLSLPPRRVRRWSALWVLAVAVLTFGSAIVVAVSGAVPMWNMAWRLAAVWVAHPLLERLGVAAAATAVGLGLTEYMSWSAPASSAPQGRRR